MTRTHLTKVLKVLGLMLTLGMASNSYAAPAEIIAKVGRVAFNSAGFGGELSIWYGNASPITVTAVPAGACDYYGYGTLIGIKETATVSAEDFTRMVSILSTALAFDKEVTFHISDASGFNCAAFGSIDSVSINY
jgi:hypothetical protein